jgi:hypothetical protein
MSASAPLVGIDQPGRPEQGEAAADVVHREAVLPGRRLLACDGQHPEALGGHRVDPPLPRLPVQLGVAVFGVDLLGRLSR